jgi:hypothetical protein
MATIVSAALLELFDAETEDALAVEAAGKLV